MAGYLRNRPTDSFRVASLLLATRQSYIWFRISLGSSKNGKTCSGRSVHINYGGGDPLTCSVDVGRTGDAEV